MTTKALSNEARVNARFAAMALSMQTQRLSLQLRDQCDAVWNHELLGEHEGGTTECSQSLTIALPGGRLFIGCGGVSRAMESCRESWRRS
jgi:hypothetical protein